MNLKKVGEFELRLRSEISNIKFGLPRPETLHRHLESKSKSINLTTNTNIMNEAISKEELEKEDHFIKQYGSEVAEMIQKNLPHERQGQFFEYVKEIIRQRHIERIQECSKDLAGLQENYEQFQNGFNGK